MSSTFYFHDIANEHALGYSVILSILITGFMIRALYWFSAENHENYPSTAIYLAVIGKRWLSRLSFCSVCMISLLAFHIEYSYKSTSSFFSLDSISVGWWCVIRIILCTLAALATSLFDSSTFFRITCICVYPICSILDMLSEISLVLQLHCISSGTCRTTALASTSTYNNLNLMAWRDHGSIVVTLTCFGLSSWLAACYGFGQSTIYLPPLEHRMMSKRLDYLQITKPKLNRNKQTQNNYY
jgi:hypothetical protein